MATIVSIASYPFLPAKVGGQKNVALFYKYFCRYHRLVCISTKKNDITAAEGYQVLNFLSNSKLRYINVFYFFVVRKIIKQNNATHLMIEHPYYGWLAVLVKKFCDVKLIIHSHNIEGMRWKTLGKWWWKILWRYEKFTHRHADYNLFISDEDKQYAIENFGLKESSCMTMTYGIEWETVPPKEELARCSEFIREKYKITNDEIILLFNGAFNYGPNLDGLKKITDLINPKLQIKKDFRYKIIICGKDIPVDVSNKQFPNIIFAGFVDDISIYLKAADIFINPISEGGGIKTKLVEALGFNMNAVSTANGAIGVHTDYCNGKLFISNDDDWDEFADLIIKASNYKADLPSIYFENFYWGYTTKKAAVFIEQ